MLPVPDFKIEKKNDFDLIGKVKVKILVVITLFVAVLFSAQLVFANKLATDGERLAHIEDEIQTIEAQNTTLRAQIAQESSLVKISQKAKDLGFQNPAKVITP